MNPLARRFCLSVAFVLACLAASTSWAQTALRDIEARGSVTIAVTDNYPPYGSKDADGQPVGFDIDVARYIARSLGVRLVMVPVLAANRVAIVESRQADLTVAALTRTPERASRIELSIPYVLRPDNFPVMVGVAKGEMDLLAKVNEIVGKGRADGEMSRMEAAWFDRAASPTGAGQPSGSSRPSNATAAAVPSPSADDQGARASNSGNVTTTSSSPSFPTPTGTNPSGPACATGQQEVVSAQRACANGNAAMCTRVSQLMSAMRRINCTIPVLAGGQASESGAATGQQRAASPPLSCVRQQRTSNGHLELYNGCGFVINYSFCVQGSQGAFTCKASMDSEGMDSIRPGQTSSGFVGSNVVFVACQGALGSPTGLTSHLEGGRGSCRP